MDRAPIVLAHDDEELLKRLEHRLTSAGYAVTACANGEGALDAVLCAERAVLLTGVQFCAPTGNLLTAEVRSARPDGEVYVILLTDSAPAFAANSTPEPAFDDYLPVSAPESALLTRLRVAEHVLRLRAQISQPDADP